ncbi:MAG: DEAD/DEAH box helicase family protein [Bacteroidetes bacterium]|nr:DEAD/DEAH box helicase family protein [Bacteroidota bacterium]
MYTPATLPMYDEIISSITKHLDNPFPFLMTCGRVRTVRDNLIKDLSHISESVSLRPHQAIMYDKLGSYPSRSVLRAPVGFGKTYIALKRISEFLECSSDNTMLMLIPPALLGFWVNTLQSAGLYHPDPLKSVSLIRHSSRSKHWNYYKTVSNGSFLNRILVVTKYDQVRELSYLFSAIIIDELHKIPKSEFRHYSLRNSLVRQLHKYNDWLILDHNAISLNLKYNYVGRELEQLKVKYVDVSNYFIKMERVIPDVRIRMLPEETDPVALFSAMTNCVFFCNRDGEDRDLWTELTSLDNTYKVVGSTKILSKLNDKTRIVMPYSSAEGLTINCPNVIMYFPARCSIERISQCIGRFIRSSNPHKTINIHCITCKYGIPKIVSGKMYTFMESHIKEKFEFPSRYRLTSLMLLNLLKVKVEDLDLYDFQVIFCDSIEMLEQIILPMWIKHHNPNTTVLTEEMIRSAIA